MRGALVQKYKDSKGLMRYVALTYADKVISFVLPLSVLFILKDKAFYTFIEVAFSYATLLMILIETGISNYLFFGYKHAGDKDDFVIKAKSFFHFLLLVYCGISLIFFFGLNLYSRETGFLAVFIAVRALYTLYIAFYSNIFRLNDTPSRIYKVSIILNLLSFILLLVAYYYELAFKKAYFLIPPAGLLVYTCVKFVAREALNFDFSGFFSYLKKALKFSWPIILNILAMSYVNNYAKIYAYGHLRQDEMLEISYIMRIGLIVQLTHSSFSSYFSKTLFMDTSRRLNTGIFKKYNTVLLLSVLMVVFIIFATNILFASHITIPMNLSTFLFLLYILIWCYIGYLELYFGVMNKNRLILYYSIISSVIYTILLRIPDQISVFQLAFFMVISGILNLLLVLSGLRRLGVMGRNKSGN